MKNVYEVIFYDHDERMLMRTFVICKNKVIAIEKAFSRNREWRNKDRVSTIKIIEDKNNYTDSTNYEV
jgi:hypothetical protein